jgi:hypothetical protein
MKSKIRCFAFILMALSACLIFGTAHALTINHGLPIIAIDGDGDANITVDILSTGGTSTYQYGYFLNGSSTFINITGINITTFSGGEVIDFALYDLSNYYKLSGDLGDDSYSVLMTFSNPVTTGSPQQPANWTGPYFYNANITWTLPNVFNTNALALNFESNMNDGIAPVPEPGTLLLLGSGLAGMGILSRWCLKKRI